MQLMLYHFWFMWSSLSQFIKFGSISFLPCLCQVYSQRFKINYIQFMFVFVIQVVIHQKTAAVQYDQIELIKFKHFLGFIITL